MLFSDQFWKGDVPPPLLIRPPKPLGPAHSSYFLSSARRSYRKASTIERQSERFRRCARRARSWDQIKALVRSKGPTKKGGDINKVTLFRGACWQEVDRCRGLFFGVSIESNVSLWQLGLHIHIFIKYLNLDSLILDIERKFCCIFIDTFIKIF